MSFGFSVGDFIAGINLAIKGIDALRDSGNAVSHFQGLAKELEELKGILQQVQQLTLPDKLASQKAAFDAAISRHLIDVEEFWIKVSKYEPRLQSTSKRLSTKDAWAPIKWAVCKKEDVEEFRARIRGHVTSLSFLLQKFTAEVATLTLTTSEAQHADMMTFLRDFATKVMIEQRAIATTVATTLQNSQDLITATSHVASTNTQVFSAVNRLHDGIIYQRPRLVYSEPVYLTDPWNIEAPFHLEFIKSREALLSVFRANFQAANCDAGIIDRHEFVVEELGSYNYIDLFKPWGTSLRPGQRIAMSVITRLQNAPAGSCPRCQHIHQSLPGKEVICQACGMTYRRVEQLLSDKGTMITKTSPREIRQPFANKGKLLKVLIHAGPQILPCFPFDRIRLLTNVPDKREPRLSLTKDEFEMVVRGEILPPKFYGPMRGGSTKKRRFIWLWTCSECFEDRNSILNSACSGCTHQMCDFCPIQKVRIT